MIDPPRLSVFPRFIAALIATACLVVLCVAAYIAPDRRGVGTHRQLGLDACQFEVRSGLPCPTCGMTTSFAHFVRGQIPASLYVQPAGTIAAFFAAMTVWAGYYVALTGRPAYRVLRFVPARFFVISIFAIVILGWVWKIWIHVNGRDGW